MPITQIDPYYNVGTATFAASTAVVGQNTLWLGNVEPGDQIFNRLGQMAVVASVNSNTSITLTTAFAGTTQTAAAYNIYRVPDSVRLENFNQRLLNLLASGVNASFASLPFVADRLAYSTGAGTFALTPLTATARSLLDDTSTAAMLATLGAPSSSEVVLKSNNGSDFNNKRATLDNLELLGTAVASATTLNLTETTGRILDVTGTATITSVVIPSGSMRVCRFTGAAKITTSTNLVLNNGTETTHQLSAGDIVVFWSWGTVVRGQIVPIDGRSTSQMATARIKGRSSAGTGLVEDLTGAQVLAMIGAQPAGNYWSAANYSRTSSGDVRRLVFPSGDILIYGSVVVTLDSLGDANITFPWAFPAFGGRPQATNGDPFAFNGAGLSVTVAYESSNPRTGFIVRFRSASGGVPAGEIARVNYSVWGY